MPQLDALLDPGDDFENFDFLESVTYRSRGDREQFTEYPNVTALPRSGAVAEQVAGIETTVFHILASSLPVAAKPRDEVVDEDGAKWVVVSVNRETFGSRYRLSVHKARR